ncbi:hypothetical protein HMPREF2141_02844 [Bacteroides uniformis]|nr:hypothetical protein HMPREF2141_02844 [Bacteroides uniformis]
MPNERQTILLRMNNIDNQLLIFYREKGKFGCLWCGDVEKIHSRYSTISLSSLEVLFVGGLFYRCNKIWCSCSGCIFFSGWECF